MLRRIALSFLLASIMPALARPPDSAGCRVLDDHVTELIERHWETGAHEPAFYEPILVQLDAARLLCRGGRIGEAVDLFTRIPLSRPRQPLR